MSEVIQPIKTDRWKFHILSIVSVVYNLSIDFIKRNSEQEELHYVKKVICTYNSFYFYLINCYLSLWACVLLIEP